MQKDRCLSIFLAAFLLIGCTESTKTGSTVNDSTPQVTKNEPEIHEANPQERVKQSLTNMWDAIEKGDIDRYASYIHPNFTRFGETAKTLRVGKDAEVKAIRDWIEEPTKVHTEMKDPRITIRGDTAWITYYWEDNGTSKGKPFATHGKSTRIFVKDAGKWLCIHGHYTLLGDEKE